MLFFLPFKNTNYFLFVFFLNLYKMTEKESASERERERTNNKMKHTNIERSNDHNRDTRGKERKFVDDVEPDEISAAFGSASSSS